MRRVLAPGWLILLLYGCSFYSAEPLRLENLAQAPYHSEEESIYFIIRPMDLLEDTNEYFQADLIEEGFLPFHLLVLNRGNDRISLGRNRVSLALNGTSPLSPTPAKKVASELNTSKVSGLPIFLSIPALASAFWTDYNRSYDYQQKEFPDQIVVGPQEAVAGVVFFKLPEQVDSASGSQIAVRFRNLRTRTDQKVTLLFR